MDNPETLTKTKKARKRAERQRYVGTVNKSAMLTTTSSTLESTTTGGGSSSGSISRPPRSVAKDPKSESSGRTMIQTDVMEGFEIRVALIGYVSVGKTMILNALLKDTYSEVSMQRATAGVNHFRIHAKKPTTTTESKQEEDEEDDSTSSASTVMVTADTILKETMADNQVLRNSDVLQQKMFDIEVDEPLCEMRNDTKLVLIDVPGINEAGVSEKYRNYVSSHWHTFDCVIVVLDGRQGVNTEEQVELLKLAKTQCHEVKEIPLIVLLNKIDDPDEEEQKGLVKEATDAVASMFNVVVDREQSLRKILAGARRPQVNMSAYSPIVIPISAVYAFIYRTASSLTLELFKQKMDRTLIDKLGKETYGRRWKKFSEQQKIEKAFEVIQDTDQFEDGLEESRFNDFIKALSFCVGGAETQKWLIERQIKVLTSRLKHAEDYVQGLNAVYDMSTRLGLEDCGPSVFSRFLDLFKKSEHMTMTSFKESPKNVSLMAAPMTELLSVCNLLKHMDMLDSRRATRILKIGQGLVLRQIDQILSPDSWKHLSLTPFDWIMIYGAVIGQTHDRKFDEHFGVARILLEKNFTQACVQSHPLQIFVRSATNH